MSSANTTTALTVSLASLLLASGIGALMPGQAGAELVAPTQVSITPTAPAGQDSSTTVAPVEQLETTIQAETTEQHDLVVWALGRFEQAGLELPVMTIVTHSDRDDCNGLNGFLSHADGGEFTIHSCGVDFTLLHELAHAWDIHTLDDETRAKFLEDAQATTWDNPDHWHLAGGEHAANVVAWGLMNTRINQTRTRPFDFASMLKAFDVLTDGGQPLWSLPQD